MLGCVDCIGWARWWEVPECKGMNIRWSFLKGLSTRGYTSIEVQFSVLAATEDAEVDCFCLVGMVGDACEFEVVVEC